MTTTPPDASGDASRSDLLDHEVEPASPLPALSARMADLARRLRSESRDTDTILRAISAAAVESIPHAEYASITLVEGKGVGDQSGC